MKLFMSYASEDQDLAERIALALRGAGHDVFFDRASISPSDEFHRRIRRAIDASELFIFLISPHSVADGSYAHSELSFAQAKWPAPEGRVLPVIISDTTLDNVPSYLRAVSILEPKGDVAAEVAAWVDALRPPKSAAATSTVWQGVALALLLTTVVLAFSLWRSMTSEAQAAVGPVGPDTIVVFDTTIVSLGDTVRVTEIDTVRVPDIDTVRVTSSSAVQYDSLRLEGGTRLTNGGSRRTVSRTVRFSPAFEQVPMVNAGLSNLVYSEAGGQRTLSVEVTRVTPEFFEVVVTLPNRMSANELTLVWMASRP